MAAAGKAVVLASGKRGLLAGGKAALFDALGECAACCEEVPSEVPCTDCAGEVQPDAVISVIGECEGACCDTVEGVYSFVDFETTAGFCIWTWLMGDPDNPPWESAYIFVSYEIATGEWMVQINGDIGDLMFVGTWNDVSGIGCYASTGFLKAALSLPGTGVLCIQEPHCEGCTYNITLGG